MVSNTDSRVTTGLPTGRGSFTGLLGFGVARYDSPVTFTFRHRSVGTGGNPPVDGPLDRTPFNRPMEGSHAAVSTRPHERSTVVAADRDRSAIAADRERPSLVADPSIATVHRSPRRSRSTRRIHQLTEQSQQSIARSQRSTAQPQRSAPQSQPSTAPSQHSTTQSHRPRVQLQRSAAHQLTEQSHQLAAQPRQSTLRPPMTPLGALDTRTELLTAANDGDVHRSRRRLTDVSPTVSRLAVGSHSQPSVSLTDPAQPVDDMQTASDTIAGRVVGSHQAGHSHRPRPDRRYRSAEQDVSRHFGGPPEPVDTTDGVVETGVESDTIDRSVGVDRYDTVDSFVDISRRVKPRTRGSPGCSLRRVAADCSQPTAGTAQSSHDSRPAVSDNVMSGRPLTADHRSTGSQWRPAALTSQTDSVRSDPTARPADGTTGATDSGPPLRAVGSTSASANPPVLSTPDRQQPVANPRLRTGDIGSESSHRPRTAGGTRQPRQASTPFSSLRSAAVSGRLPPITSDATVTDLDHTRLTGDYIPRPTLTPTAYRRVSRPATTRGNHSPTDIRSSLMTSPDDSLPDRRSPGHTQISSTVSPDRLPAASSGPQSRGRDGDGSRQIHVAASWQRSPTPVVSTHAITTSAPVASGSSLAPVASGSSLAPVASGSSLAPVASGSPRRWSALSGPREFDSNRVFLTVNESNPLNQERSTRNATASDHRRQPSIGGRPWPERPRVSGRSPAASQRHRSRDPGRAAVGSSPSRTSSPTQTAATHGSAGESTGVATVSQSFRRAGSAPRMHRPRNLRRELTGSPVTSHVVRPPDSSPILSQQPQRPLRLQLSASSRFSILPAWTNHLRRLQLSRSGLESDRRPRQQSPSGLRSNRRQRPQSPSSASNRVTGGHPAEPPGVGSARNSRWPSKTTRTPFNPVRRRDDLRSQPTLAPTRPTGAAVDRSQSTRNAVHTGSSPAVAAPILTDPVPTGSRRPALTQRSVAQSSLPPLCSVPSSVRSRRFSVATDRTPVERTDPRWIPTGSQTGSTVESKTVSAATAPSHFIDRSDRSTSSNVADRLASTAGRVDSPGTETPNTFADLTASSEPSTPLGRPSRRSAVVSRHRVATVGTEASAGSRTRAGGSTDSQSATPRQQSTTERGRTTDRTNHQSLSSPGRRSLPFGSARSVSTTYTTGPRHMVTGLNAPVTGSDAPVSTSDIPATSSDGLGTIKGPTPTPTTTRRSALHDETDIDWSRLSAQQDVGSRSVALGPPTITLSWQSSATDRPIRHSRQSTGGRVGSEPIPRPSDSAEIQPFYPLDGSQRTGVPERSLSGRSHRHRSPHRHHSADSLASMRSSESAAVSQRSESSQGDVSGADGEVPEPDQRFKRPAITTIDHPPLRRGRPRRSLSAGGIARTVTPRSDPRLGAALAARATSRSDSVGSSLVSGVSASTLVDRDAVGTELSGIDPIGAGYDASVLSVATAPRTDAEPSDSGRRPDGTGGSTRVSSGRQPRRTRSSTATHASEEASAASAEPGGSNSDQRRIEPDEPGDRDSRPRLTFKKPSHQRVPESAHGAATGREGADRHHRREQSTATSATATSRENTRPRSEHRDRATTRLGPFDPVEQPDRQPGPTTDKQPDLPTDQQSVGRSTDARRNTGRQPRGGFDDPLSGASLAYDADVDRVVETLYRRLERKLRIERERTGF